MDKKQASFEENLAKLEDIVKELESGETPLKESIEKFEEGLEIIKQCYEELENAEGRVEKIVKKDGKILIEPFGNR